MKYDVLVLSGEEALSGLISGTLDGFVDVSGQTEAEGL